MRLLHVTHQYRPAIGGAETYITSLSEALVSRGHDVDVYTSRSVEYRTWRNTLPRFETLAGVNVRRFDSLRRTDFIWRVLRFGFKHYWRTERWWYEPFIYLGNGPVCLGMFLALLRNGSAYDLVHISNIHYSHAFLAYLAVRFHHIPYVVTPHIHAEQKETHDVGYMRAVLRGSDAILAVSRAEKIYLLEKGWNHDVVVGGNGLRLEDFSPIRQFEARAHFELPKSGFVMLFLGRKASYKGLDMCLEAFLMLRQRRKDVYFLAIGPETEFSEDLWTRYSKIEGLIVRGRVSDKERLMALAACDVLVLPSVGEAFGIVYLEAWAYGKPVVGANIPSVASVVEDGSDGFLVRANESGDLVERLERLIADPVMSQTMGSRGRAKLGRRYTVERIADIVEGTYARVLRQFRTCAEPLDG